MTDNLTPDGWPEKAIIAAALADDPDAALPLALIGVESSPRHAAVRAAVPAWLVLLVVFAALTLVCAVAWWTAR